MLPLPFQTHQGSSKWISDTTKWRKCEKMIGAWLSLHWVLKIPLKATSKQQANKQKIDINGFCWEKRKKKKEEEKMKAEMHSLPYLHERHSYWKHYAHDCVHKIAQTELGWVTTGCQKTQLQVASFWCCHNELKTASKSRQWERSARKLNRRTENSVQVTAVRTEVCESAIRRTENSVQVTAVRTEVCESSTGELKTA